MNAGFDSRTFLFLIMLMILSGSLGQALPPVDQIIMVMISFVIAISVHECMHAFTAYKLGDQTAYRLGRVTLNPVAHFDPFGFFGLLMISLGRMFIGWGKPVPVQPGNFTGRWRTHRKQGMFLVTAAGPLSNVALAMLSAIPFQIMVRSDADWGVAGDALNWFIIVNVLLASFNMIPVPPLDGYRMLTAVLPNFWAPRLRPLERWGFMILILLVFLGGNVGGSFISGMIDPVQRLLQDIVFYGLFRRVA